MAENEHKPERVPEKTILDYDTVALDEEKNELVIIDQTKLPGKQTRSHPRFRMGHFP